MGNTASSLIAARIMEPNNLIVFALKRRAENAEQEDDDYFVDMAQNISMMQQANARRGGDKEALETRRRRHRSCKKARSSLLILDETGNLARCIPETQLGGLIMLRVRNLTTQDF
jgi:hypothetical protein